MVVFCDPGSVPENWKLISEENVEAGSSIPISDNMACDSSVSSLSSSDRIQRTPVVRYCNHCQNGKPPRCHHCSICKRYIIILFWLLIFLPSLTTSPGP